MPCQHVIEILEIEGRGLDLITARNSYCTSPKAEKLISMWQMELLVGNTHDVV